MAIDRNLIDELLSSLPKRAAGTGARSQDQRAFGYEKHDPAGQHGSNSCNGENQNRKTLNDDFGERKLESPLIRVVFRRVDINPCLNFR